MTESRLTNSEELFSTLKTDFICCDASVAINLLSTGRFPDILEAIPIQVVLEETVLGELKHHPVDRSDPRIEIANAERNGFLRRDALHETRLPEFFQLVSGDIASSIGDGESATIVIARQIGGVPVLDDQKAIRVMREHFGSDTKVVSSLDILSHPAVVTSLGESLAPAIIGALDYGRMRVPPEYEAWVKNCVGVEKFAKCSSIRMDARLEALTPSP
jgi:predicted nucleic acid-binding protein